KQRGRRVGFRQEFRVKLASNEPRVVLDFDHLDQTAVRTGATDDKSMLLEQRPIFQVELVAVPMAFDCLIATIGTLGKSTGYKLSGPAAEAHRGTFISHLFLFL